MFQIIIVLHNNATNFLLSYKSKDSAEAAHLNIESRKKECVIDPNSPPVDKMVSIKDDYGHIVSVMASGICGVLLTDAEEESQADIERKLIMHRAQKKFQDRVDSEPSIRMVGGRVQ